MYSKWIKSGFILAMLLVSMVSLSMAGCPWFIKNDLYTAQCGVLKVVPASNGILANDPAGTKVVDPESIEIDPKYGTILVNEDGSFVYDPTGATALRSGIYVIFKYGANNGFCDAKYLGIAKIQVSCKCRAEVCDGIDNDCDGEVDEGGVCCTDEVCDDGVDNDCDGLTDGDDSDCTGPDPECAPATCGNFIPCNEGGSCGSGGVCASTAEGSGVCIAGSTPCALNPCTGTSDCAAGEFCGVGSCCGDGSGLCVPPSFICSDAGAKRATTATNNGSPTDGPTFGGN